MAIDLHTHSTVSDGSLTPEEVVRTAKRLGLSAIAVSDHDTCLGAIRALKEGKRVGIEVISAVEISTSYENKVLHILGYFVDPTDAQLTKKLAEIQDYRIWRTKEIFSKVNQDLVVSGKNPVSTDAFFKWAGPEKLIMRTDIAQYFVEAGLVKNHDEAFQRWLIKYNIPSKILTPKEVIALVHEAKGMAILAHPGAERLSLNEISTKFTDHKKIIRELREQGLDGIEALYPEHSQKAQDEYMALAEELNLVITGGSDFHGPNVAYLPQSIGAVKVDDSILRKLKEKCKK